jgi:hypothetical protein
MKIEIMDEGRKMIEMDTSILDVIVSEAYNGVTLKTSEVGDVGLCMRDGGIWLLKDGIEFFRYDMNGAETPALSVCPACKQVTNSFCGGCERGTCCCEIGDSGCSG